MKLKIHHSKKDDGGVAVAERPKAKGTKNMLTPAMFDDRVQYVGRRIRIAEIRNSVIGTELTPMLQDGYLLVHGDKPGLLIHEVKWDGDDLYQRKDRHGNRIGSLKALNSTQHKRFRAEVIDRKELLERLRKHNKLVKVKHLSSNKEHTVALLNNFGQPYIAGVEVIGGELHPLNMEPSRAYNSHVPQVRYGDPVDVKMDINKYLPKH